MGKKKGSFMDTLIEAFDGHSVEKDNKLDMELIDAFDGDAVERNTLPGRSPAVPTKPKSLVVRSQPVAVKQPSSGMNNLADRMNKMAKQADSMPIRMGDGKQGKMATTARNLRVQASNLNALAAKRAILDKRRKELAKQRNSNSNPPKSRTSPS